MKGKTGKINVTERIASIVMLAASGAYFIGAFFIAKPAMKQQLGPDGFPKAIGAVMIILSCIYIFQQFKGHKLTEAEKKEIEERAGIIGAEEKVEGKIDMKTVGYFLVVMFVYAFLFERLGYALSTFLAFMAGVLWLDRRHLIRDSIVAIIASFGLYFIFTMVLRVQLPAGLLSYLGL
jgi:putative tricarboxylic transport membrane protein